MKCTYVGTYLFDNKIKRKIINPLLWTKTVKIVIIVDGIQAGVNFIVFYVAI
jgi:hypothetical protein